ncbi:DHA2 family efflux MFS transporter permease subunit [Desulfallas sp. Bu1-1]|nr:DHA2 family efflux MFS transporter permease subunit [Desulfallas sp. Bu1-1]
MVLVTGAFAAILNNSSINVAVPKLMTIFGVDADKIQWVVTAYMLSSGVIIPVTGFLGDRFGTRRIFVVSLAAFTTASLLCSIAWNINTMIAFRVIQGIGGGMMMPISMAIIYRIVPRETIGLALGIWGMAAITAPAIGPTLGGYIIDNFNWRFLFLLNIPIGLTGLLLTPVTVPESKKITGLSFDRWGFLLCTTGCFTLLLALSEGHKKGWDSLFIITLLIYALFSLVLFAIVELSIPEPMLDLRLLKNKTFTISIITGALITMGLFGGVFLVPLFTQNIMNMTPYETGLLLMPAAIVSALMQPVSGFLFDRIGARPLGLAGLTITGVFTWKLQYITAQTSPHYLTMLMTIRSIGMGLAMMPITTAGMNVVPRHLVPRASSLNNVFRQVSASLGIALLTAIMVNRQALHGAHLSENLTIYSPALTLAHDLFNLLSSSGLKLTVLFGLVQSQALVSAINDTFLVSSLFIFLAIPFVLFLGDSKPVPSKPAKE